jgi:hypothetical protein
MIVHPIHPWVDPAHAPVYHLTYPAYDPNDPRQLARYSAEHASLYATMGTWTSARTRAFGFTIDMSSVRSSAMTRQHAVLYLEKIRRRGSPHMACRAFVTPNESVRGVLTAVFWQSPPDFPHAFFETIEQARSWARDHVLALDLRETRSASEQQRKPRVQRKK